MAILFKLRFDMGLHNFSPPGTTPAPGASVGRVGHLRHRWVGHAALPTPNRGRVW